ncbi:MAG TPA: LodA/GoxA family CTQ-dependent oxidase [Pyrinomonadaceae bacterium]|jgi:hypothetical protein
MSSNKSSAGKKATAKKSGPRSANAAAGGAAAGVDQRIAYCMIHPGLGIARIGNSPDEFFVGPESPGHTVNPPGGFKDAAGRIKRQAARFRIYAYNKQGVAIKELTADDAEITWTVELANQKAAYEMFLGMYWAIQYPTFKGKHPLRNQEIPGELGDPARDVLVIKPPPVTIAGRSRDGKEHQFVGGTIGPLPYTVKTAENAACLSGSRSGFMNVYPFAGLPACAQSYPPPDADCQARWKPGELITPTALSAQVEVPLGEARTDEQGRLLVLGGQGNSASLIPDNEIGFLNLDSYYANNDYWYDDTSDGSIAAKVVLKDGTELKVADKAWVIVAPPKYSPHTQVLTTLYDVAMDTAAKRWPSRDGDGKGPVSFMNDVFPLLSRLSNYQWVNSQANRQHGAGKVYDILDPARLKLFRTPGNKNVDAVHERQYLFHRVRVPVELLPGKNFQGELANSQANHRFMPQMAGNGGEPVVYGAQDADCTLGGTYITWMTLSVHQYKSLERWAKGDFVDDWPKTPAGKPDSPDHLPPAPLLGEIAVADQPAALDEAALEFCVGESTYPGIEMTYISHDPATWSAPCRINQSFRPGDITRHMALPWQADFAECKDHWWPAQRPDDVVPEAEYADLLKTYDPQRDGPLAEVVASPVPWARGIAAESPQLDNDMVEAWKDFGFVVQKRGPGDQLVYIETERSPYAGMNMRDFFYYLMNIDSYPDFLPKARTLVEEFLRQAEANEQEAALDDASDRWSFFEYSPEAFAGRLDQIYNGFVTQNSSDTSYEKSLMQTREDVIYGQLQMAPFNQLDGAWLRGATPPGPLDEVHELIFSIYMDELGDGRVEWNHCNVYTDLLKSVNIYLPDLHTREYADDPRFLDSAFTEPVFILAISQFSQEYFPEILGMTMYLEWESIGLISTVDTFKAFGIDPLYYTLHVGIDNAASGHGAIARQAIETYLDQVREQQGEQAMRAAWKRIWNGYVAFGTLGTLGQDIANAINKPESLHDQMIDMINRKAPYASLNHRKKTVGPNYINDWFLNPEGFLTELQKAGYIVAGQPDISPIFQLMSFNGPMFHVFTDAEQQLWRDYVLSLGEDDEPADYQIVEKMRETIDYLRRRQEGNNGHNVQIAGPNPKPDAKKGEEIVTQSIHDWFDLNDDDALMRALSYEKNGWILKGNAAQSPLVTDMLSGNNDMALAFRDVAPGTGGKTYKEILVEWIDKGCPVGAEPQAAPAARMRVLSRMPQPAGVRVTAQAQGDETRQRKIWGMGKVH